MSTDGTDPEAAVAIDAAPTLPVWGPWATAGFGLLILLLFVIVQVAVVIAFVVTLTVSGSGAAIGDLAATLAHDGLLLSLATFASAIACVAGAALFARLRNGLEVADYLGLRPVAVRSVLTWIGAALVFAAISDTVTYLLDRSIVPEFMITAYTSIAFKPLLWAATCLAAPAFEEVVFRGFLFTGFQASRLGAVGATLLTTLVWTGIHLQYGAYELTIVFLMGLLLCLSRIASRSIVPALVVHAAINTIAFTETAIAVARMKVGG